MRATRPSVQMAAAALYLEDEASEADLSALATVRLPRRCGQAMPAVLHGRACASRMCCSTPGWIAVPLPAQASRPRERGEREGVACSGIRRPWSLGPSLFQRLLAHEDTLQEARIRRPSE